MNKNVLYSRLTLNPNDKVKPKNEETSSLLENEENFEPPKPHILILKLQAAKAFLTEFPSRIKEIEAEKYFEHVKKIEVMSRMQLFYALVSVVVVITFINTRAIYDNQTQRQIYHASKPSVLTTHIGKLWNNTLTYTYEMSSRGYSLPPVLQNLREINETSQPFDIPFFLHTPRSGGGSVKAILGECLGLIVASEMGRGHEMDNNLLVLSTPWNVKFPNVDVSTLQGLQKAQQFQLFPRGGANILYSQLFYDGALLFNQQQKGRMFIMIRNPVHRQISQYYYDTIKHDGISHSSSTTPEMSLFRWINSGQMKENLLTRQLTNEMHGTLTPNHLELAKETLRRLFIVGILEEKQESVLRFLNFFQFLNWKHADDRAMECQDKNLNYGWKNAKSHPVPDHDAPFYQLLEEKNSYDMEIYHFARQLFDHQAKLFVREKGGRH